MKRGFIPAGPLPTVKELCRLWAGREGNGLPWGRGKEMTFHSHGRLALREAVQRALGEGREMTGVVWLPDYFCDEVVTPLRRENARIGYYPVKRDLAPDLERVERLLRRDPGAVVIVHYFGFPNPLGDTARLADKYGALIIEDAAHALVPCPGIKEDNMTVYSPRKVLPVPAGGLLVSPGGGEAVKEVSCRRRTGLTGWALKSVLKMALFSLGIPWKKALPADDRSTEPENLKEGYSSERIINAIAGSVEGAVRRRRQNYSVLLDALKAIDEINFPFQALPEGVCPYAFPVLVERRDEVMERLALSGVSARSWPAVPREVSGKRPGHEDAIWLKDRMMLLPIHQSLGQAQMKAVARALKKALAKRYV